MSPREREPGRTCLGCRRQFPRAGLIRIVRGPDGAAVFDLDGRLPGRGAWVCPTPACLNAVAPGALGHVLRAPVRLADTAGLRRDLCEALRRRLTNLLTMARRMRGMVLGPTGVRAALTEGRAKLVLVACDAAPEAADSWRARSAPVRVSVAPPAAEFGALFGGRAVDVAAVTAEGLAGTILEAAERWRAFAAELCDNEKSINDGSPRGGAAAGGG